MGAKVKISVKTTLLLKDLPKNIKKNFSRELKRDIGDAIVKEILEGRSPVRGKKFEQYSVGYGKIKGRRKPVDLLGSGKMLESIRVVQTKIGRVVIKFLSPIAKYHNGEGRVDRLMLPNGRQTFNARLTKIIDKILDKAIKKATK